MLENTLNTTDILEENGLLSRAIPGFTPRQAQQKMAETIEKTIDLDAQLIVEAGTGTGKTFGYLVPIFLAQKKSIISTGTKNLQDQLFFNDIPLINKLLSKETTYHPKIVLLKGRANYLCLYRLQKNRDDGRFATRQLVSELQHISNWSALTTHGDISELNTIAEDSIIWPYVTSTADNCLNQDCSFYKNCFVLKARQQALAADIVVVNHHLFFADMVLQDDGFGELLPGVDTVVFDEAHHLPDIAARFFSTTFSSRQLLELSRDIISETKEIALDMEQLNEACANLQDSTQAMRNIFGFENKSTPWPENLSPDLAQTILKIKSDLTYLEEILQIAAPRSKDMEACWKRCVTLIELFAKVTSEAAENQIHWMETHPQSFVIHLTPLVVAPYFKRFLEDKNRSWIFTSATLTVKNNFSLFVETLGLHQALQLQLQSPFDYQRQALLYAPRGLPDPNSLNFTESMLEAALPLIEVLQGKTFILFTSHRALEKAANFLENRLKFPLLRQGTKPKRQLIEEFKELGNAVLLGTSSFWSGVDVRGKALSCVIIDKLPFTAPDDPILQAKIKMLRKKDLDPFFSLQLPNAVLILKQGVGRLIRDAADRGILMICDPRLVGCRYAEVFLQSLPAMSRTRDLEKVKEFIYENISV